MKTRIVLSLALLATLSFGQNPLTVSLNPQFAPVGTPITVSVNDTFSTGLFTPGNNTVLGEVRQGSPTGPTVAMFPTTFLPGAIPPCNQPPRSNTWTPAGGLAAGEYFIAVTYSVGMFGAFNTEWFCVTFEDATPPFYAKPTITPVTTPTIGTTYVVDIDGANRNGDTYLMAMSFTTSVGIPLGGLHFGLDTDGLFDLTIPVPNPLLFSNFQGNLDINGHAGGIGFNIPNAPSIQWWTVNMQAAVIPPPGASWALDFTHCHTFTIL